MYGQEYIGLYSVYFWLAVYKFYAFYLRHDYNKDKAMKRDLFIKNNKKAQDACEKFARFTYEQWGCKLYS